MTKIKGFIDADGHVVESDAELLQFLPRAIQGPGGSVGFSIFSDAGRLSPPGAKSGRRQGSLYRQG